MRTERPWPRVERSVSTGYVPPGWPERVRPPGAPDWELTATEFLLDCCPADYRRYRLLRRHPVVLARFAAVFVGAQERERGAWLRQGPRHSCAQVRGPGLRAADVESAVHLHGVCAHELTVEGARVWSQPETCEDPAGTVPAKPEVVPAVPH